MIWLVAASLIWAFSFGLIKQHLAVLDPWFVAVARLSLAGLVFLPWTIARAPAAARLRVRAMLLGMVQFGAMYVFYIAAFGSLAAWQVALWTVLTPVYVALLGALVERRGPARSLLAGLLAVLGAVVAEGRLPQGAALQGVLLVQASNICFASGQIGYRSLAASTGASTRRRGREAGLLGWMYLGALALCLLGLVSAGNFGKVRLTASSIAVLLYLGIVSTGVAFWLWNRGGVRTTAGRLAVANNLKVPLAMLAAWLVFQEAVPYLRAILGLGVILGALRLASSRNGAPAMK